MNIGVELLVDAHAEVGEGPLWDDQKQVLYWVDIMKNTLYIYDPAKKENTAFDIGQHVGTVVPRESGGLMLALHHGFAAFNPETGDLTMLADPEAQLPENRFNDGKCDPAGRFWAGTMKIVPEKGAGSLYRLDLDLRVHKMVENVTVSNGLVWSLDHSTMYYIDSPAQTVTAYDYDINSGDIGNGQVIIRVPKEMGFPDGMAIDNEGMLWIAHYDGGCVRRWNPDTAEVLETIRLPVSRVTACAFGGENLDTLYITSATENLTEEQLAKEPLAGGLFAARPGYRGIKAFRFKG